MMIPRLPDRLICCRVKRGRPWGPSWWPCNRPGSPSYSPHPAIRNKNWPCVPSNQTKERHRFNCPYRHDRGDDDDDLIIIIINPHLTGTTTINKVRMTMTMRKLAMAMMAVSSRPTIHWAAMMSIIPSRILLALRNGDNHERCHR
jgi:hypothetical protein